MHAKAQWRISEGYKVFLSSISQRFLNPQTLRISKPCSTSVEGAGLARGDQMRFEMRYCKHSGYIQQARRYSTICDAIAAKFFTDLMMCAMKA